MSRDYSPFVPGFNQSPEVFAGRDRELGRFSEILEKLSKGDPLPGCIVLYGPRGNGKTSLLDVVSRRREQFCPDPKQVRKVMVEVFRPDDIRNASVYELIKGQREASEVERKRVVKGSLPAFQGGWEKTKKFNHSRERISESLRSTVSEKKPVLFCVDEAHSLENEFLSGLLEGFQSASLGGVPVGLVLSGTPHLLSHLRTIDASFVSRAEFMQLGRLDQKSTDFGLREPLERSGFSIDDEEAFTGAVDETQNYPYFIQLYGEAIWEIGKARGCTSIDTELITEARKIFADGRDVMYKNYFKEIKDEGLIDDAETIANLFEGKSEPIFDSIIMWELNAKLAHTNGAKIVRRLTELGYLLASKTEDSYEPGIPSLMSFVVQEQAAQRQALKDHKKKPTLSRD